MTNETNPKKKKVPDNTFHCLPCAAKSENPWAASDTILPNYDHVLFYLSIAWLTQAHDGGLGDSLFLLAAAATTATPPEEKNTTLGNPAGRGGEVSKCLPTTRSVRTMIRSS